MAVANPITGKAAAIFIKQSQTFVFVAYSTLIGNKNEESRIRRLRISH